MAFALQPLPRNSRKPWMVGLERLIDQLIVAIVETCLGKSHPSCQLSKQCNITLRLAEGYYRPLAYLHEQMPVSSLNVFHLKKRRCRQQHIRIVRRIGEELLMHYHEQVL